jgi:multiple antibiotic resistance protein
MTLFTLTLTLFLIINPLGNMKHFLTLLEGLKARRQFYVIAREMLIALVTMFIFSFFGEGIAAAFHLTQTAIFITSGLILFLTAIKILFSSREDYIPKFRGEEPFLVPIAIPIIASPALLATIMLFSQTEPLVWPMIVSILIAWGISIMLLLASGPILKVIGQNGLTAIERLMGMILVLISVQRFMEGVQLFIGE